MSDMSTAAHVAPDKVLDTIKKHMLVDGFPIVVDLEKSQGARMVDARNGTSYLDFFQFFASAPLGFNHPKATGDEKFLADLQQAALNNPSNSDFYSTQMAEFVATTERVVMPKELPHMFLIAGGGLAIENALKAAFDWKVRKNHSKGIKGEFGTKVIHFREAFHGRTGYTMSLTNTDPVKTMYFPKFDWPRIVNPKITFPLADHLEHVEAAEEQAKQQIKDVIHQYGDDIAALIIEPVQGEGGDNHFRPEFIKFLRDVTLEHEIIFICDEVQTGVGLTGKTWAYQHAGITPDIIAFGKKMQVCGIMSSDRINDVDSVFKVSSRINSTWGGNLVDMVRCTRYLQVIEEENLVQNAAEVGDYLGEQLGELARRMPDMVSNTRNAGLMAAFDLPNGETRNKLTGKAKENGMLIVGCGPNSIRFRPPLNLTRAEVDEGIEILEKSLKALA